MVRTSKETFVASRGMTHRISLQRRMAQPLNWTTKKMGGKVYVSIKNQMGTPLNCPVKALGRRILHLRANGATKTTIILSYFNEGRRYSVTSNHVSSALKLAAGTLKYPIIKGIPIERVNTHSLRSGGANALALARYSDTHIQKNGSLAQGHVKRICREGASVLLVWYVLRHETKIRIRQRFRQCIE